ncbi:MAG: three-helix bundle dimerization domain-containing protein [Frankiaceae bacterium]
MTVFAAGYLAVDQASLEALVSRISDEFDVAVHDVRAIALHLSTQFAGARVTSFIPLLIERELREHVRRLRTTKAGVA